MTAPNLRCFAVSLGSLALAACGPAHNSYHEARDAYARTAPAEPLAKPLDPSLDPFSGAQRLEHDAVVRAVVERNPSIEAARAGWAAALEQYPQVVALDDPMLSYELAPLSIASDDVRFGHGVMLAQPLPWPGKRRLRGEIALAEAEAARHDFRAVQLRLATMASLLYYDLFLLDRALEINAEFEQILKEYEGSILSLLETGRAWQDDASKVDLELAVLARQRIELEADRNVAVAQLNELARRPPQAPLPALPEEVEPPPVPSADSAALQARALDRRPELAALAARIEGAEHAIELAQKGYYPDFRVSGQYTTMFAMLEHQIMVGVGINLPIWRDKRRAAEEQARARAERARAERAAREDAIRAAVEAARERLQEAVATVTLYRDRLLPSARDRVDAIRIGLDSGRTTFLEVLRAERELRSVELEYHRALASAHRREAELAAAVGALPGEVTQ